MNGWWSDCCWYLLLFVGVVGGHYAYPGTGTGLHGIDYDENKGKGFEDTTDYDTKTGTGVDSYDDTGVEHATGTAPLKKGLMTKIKEMIHHTH